MTQLSDMVIVPEVFTANVNLMALEKDAFVVSGVATIDPQIAGFLSSAVGGQSISLRNINALDGSVEANVSSDVSADKASAQTLSAIKSTAVVQSKNQIWSSMDLTAELNGSDPLGAVTEGVAKYWTSQTQAVLVKSLEGVKADNIANDSGDMVIDVSVAADGTVADANRFSAESFINATLTMGDRLDEVTAIGVHSAIYGQMQKNNLIDYIPDSNGVTMIPTYQGRRVIVDDGFVAESYGTTPVNVKYTTVLFGAGSVAINNGATKTPFAIDRDELAGDGGGEEFLAYRQKLVVHPYGFKFLSASVAGETPTWAELTDATNWDRVYDRKRVKIAFLITN